MNKKSEIYESLFDNPQDILMNNTKNKYLHSRIFIYKDSTIKHLNTLKNNAIYRKRIEHFYDLYYSQGFGNWYKDGVSLWDLTARSEEIEMKILSEYFVEICSWSSMIDYDTINDILYSYNIEKVIDPMAGSGFHCLAIDEKLKEKSTLFNKDIIVEGYDIQPEDESISWFPIKEKDCRTIDWDKYIGNTCLIISWCDYSELGIYLLDNFKGSLILSIGNYNDARLNNKYYEKLSNYNRIVHQNLKMPYNMYEMVEIYENKNYKIKINN